MITVADREAVSSIYRDPRFKRGEEEVRGRISHELRCPRKHPGVPTRATDLAQDQARHRVTYLYQYLDLVSTYIGQLDQSREGYRCDQHREKRGGGKGTRCGGRAEAIGHRNGVTKLRELHRIKKKNQRETSERQLSNDGPAPQSISYLELIDCPASCFQGENASCSDTASLVDRVANRMRRTGQEMGLGNGLSKVKCE